MKKLIPAPAKRLLRSVLTAAGLLPPVAATPADSFSWSSVLEADGGAWQTAKAQAHDGKRVLIALSMGGYTVGAQLESLLAVALTLRGAQVEVLLCDRFLPACQLTELPIFPPEQMARQRVQPRCAACHAAGQAMFASLGLPVHWFSMLVDDSQRRQAREIASSLPLADLENYHYEGLAVGEHALAGALRYFARGDLRSEPGAESVLRRYLEAALLTVYATREVLRRGKYDVVCFNHGIYVPHGLIGEVARQQGVRVVNWNPAYRRPCFIFSHGDSYHHTMISEPTSEWEQLDLTPKLRAQTVDYLNSRRSGTDDWIRFHDNPQEELAQIAAETGIDFAKPSVVLLTSVMWDAKLHYRSNAFASMVDWVICTIEQFAARPDMQLIIRIHPAEIKGANKSRQPMAAEIARLFPTLPPNVFVIAPESAISTYRLVDQADCALIFNTKTGIEISGIGIPVIVAGEAWIRGKGFATDVDSPAQYIDVLKRLPLKARLSPEQLDRAQKYAFHFFFRRMIPLPFMSSGSNYQFDMALSSLSEARPGRCVGLDVICAGILNGDSFIYPTETMDS